MSAGGGGTDANRDADANRNQIWARCLIEELIRSGMRDLSLAPGSRSTPLVLAASRAAEAGELTLRVFLDERSAGFFALGLGRATGRPAAVVTTSGTAVANLLPAAVEADRGEVPLLLLTADRPRNLRDADANQSIDQVGIFGSRTRAAWDLPHPVVDEAALTHLRGVACRAVAAAVGAPAGPVHLNLPFAKPLEATAVAADQEAARELAARGGAPLTGRTDGAPFVSIGPRRSAPGPTDLHGLIRALEHAERPLFIAGLLPGHDRAAVDALIRAAASHGAPLLADPLSGARSGPSHGAVRVAGYDTFLRDAGVEDVGSALRPDLIVRFGRSPTSAVLQRWVEGLDVPAWVVDDGALWKDHAGTAHRYLRADPGLVAAALARDDGPRSSAWRARWEAVDAAVREAMRSSESAELATARAVLGSTPPGIPVFVSSSMPIRDVDTAAVLREDDLPLFGNRGASGIDGIVSTALGVAAGWAGSAAGRTGASKGRGVCLLGDLAMLHDANGLAAHRMADVVFVLIDNDGGGIFHMLPIAEHDPPFTELFATPHGRNFAKLAALHDLPHRRVEPDGVADALAEELDAGGSRILEIRTDRTTEPDARLRDRERAIEAARAALAGLDGAPDPAEPGNDG